MFKHRPSRSRRALFVAAMVAAASATGVSAQVAPAQPYFSTVKADEVTLTGN